MPIRRSTARLIEALRLRPGTPPVLPLWVGKLVSEAGEAVSRLTRKPPLIPRGQLHLLQWDAFPVADKARAELGWQMTPYQEGVPETMEFLQRG